MKTQTVMRVALVLLYLGQPRIALYSGGWALIWMLLAYMEAGS